MKPSILGRMSKFSCLVPWVGPAGPIFREVPELQSRGSTRSQSGGLGRTQEDDALWPLGCMNLPPKMQKRYKDKKHVTVLG